MKLKATVTMLVGVCLVFKAALGCDPEAKLVKSDTSWTYSVSVDIDASKEKIWELLTDAKGFPKWNSTVDKIEGDIALGNKITVYMKAMPDKGFPVSVIEFKQPSKMVWKDDTGVRTYSLRESGTGLTTFSMVEVLAIEIAPNVPDMRPTFVQYGVDLRRAAQAKKEE
jgi:uncharacterized protein YndB with AHSA1/START domain